MHHSSLLKAELFIATYAQPKLSSAAPVSVIDIGSKSYNEHDTFRSLFKDAGYAYTGLDVEAGKNVDIIPRNGYTWSEIASDSYDIVISGQTFEHNPYFWITFCEMARILKPGGHMFIIAPGGGPVHRYPYDCWRFYPDSWGALCALAGLELTETYFETDDTAGKVEGGIWRDSSVIATKPLLSDAALAAFNARLSEIVAPFSAIRFDLGENGRGEKLGPAYKAYKGRVAQDAASISLKDRFVAFARQIKGNGIVNIHK